MDDLRWVRDLPKAELHVHLEGTLEPEMMFSLAARNGVTLPFGSIEQVRAAYRFERLDDFLAIYYQGMGVLCTPEDFRELTLAYLRRAHADGVRHAEVFFDPQGHTRRGIPLAMVVDGIVAGLREAERALGVTTRLIMCFLRDLPESDALQTLEAARPFLGHLAAVGLDSSELGHPPAGFARVFAAACELGLRRVAHAGEEGPPEYVREALDVLAVDRLDHGNRAMEDPALVERLRQSQIALTVCPLSNLRLGGVRSLAVHPLRRMLAAGLRVTVNSDDPAYFGGYVHDNYAAMIGHLGLSRAEVLQLVRNSWLGAFLEPGERAMRLSALEAGLPGGCA
jgi:adenosine deaminase